MDAADVESYEYALESAPAAAQPEVEPVDVSEELSKQFEENVGDDTIRDVETDADIREDESAATPRAALPHQRQRLRHRCPSQGRGVEQVRG